MAERALGVIGGSGLYELPGLDAVEHTRVRTPFGDPSDEIVVGRLGATRLLFLPRHGRGHRLLPSELPFRANVWALKSLGADCLLAVSAVGSLREEIAPGHVVVPDQFIDRTRGRQAESTFFGRGVVAHVQFADPFCPLLARALVDAARDAGAAAVHSAGTYVCMEGPAFSTRAESHLYRSWGAHVIGMTNLQEAKLAREAELCFATLALATDYDCWHSGHEDVQIEEILKVLAANVDLARRTVTALVPRLPAADCACPRALEHAIITDRALIPADVRRDLAPIAGRYL
jgi:5'-methylthioadenosine phosphorylase